MTDQQAMVEEFHRKFEIAVSAAPMIPEEATSQLRVRLIQEEFDELKDAMAGKDLSGIAKELADLLYVVYGTAVSYGLDMEPVFQEVHRSNLSKVGGYKRADGKWVKPSTYSRAQVAPLIAAQIDGNMPSASTAVTGAQAAES
jgi:predicted HAD superfamily Cof-like phosphohydrolase